MKREKSSMAAEATTGFRAMESLRPESELICSRLFDSLHLGGCHDVHHGGGG